MMSEVRQKILGGALSSAGSEEYGEWQRTNDGDLEV